MISGFAGKCITPTKSTTTISLSLSTFVFYITVVVDYREIQEGSQHLNLNFSKKKISITNIKIQTHIGSIICPHLDGTSFFFISSNHQKSSILLNWVNSFNYPHCQQATSIADLRSGVAFCEIVYDTILNKGEPRFLSQVVINDISREDAINNITIAKEQLINNQRMPSEELKGLQPEHIHNNENALLNFLDILYQEGLNRKSEPPSFKVARVSDLSSIPRKPPLPRSSLKSRQRPQLSEESTTTIKAPMIDSSLKQEDQYLQPEANFTSIKKNHNQSVDLGSQNRRGHKQNAGSVDLRTERNSEARNTESNRTRIITTKKAAAASSLSDDEDISPIKLSIVDKVEYSTKVFLCSWLDQIHLVKRYPGIEETLSNICKDGAIFIDLINWLNGRKPILSHPAKHFKEEQTIEATYRKVLTYLSNFERMNPRYLLAYRQLAEGSDNHFWGLLDDIYHLHHNKISKYDRRYWKTINPDSSSQQKTKRDNSKNSMSQSKIVRVKNFNPHSEESDAEEEAQQLRNQPFKQQQTTKMATQTSSRHNNDYKAVLSEQRQSTRTLASVTSQRAAEKKENRDKENNKNKVNRQNTVQLSDKDIKDVYEWLRSFGFSYSLEKSINCPPNEIFGNPLRNGTLIGSLVIKLQIGKVNIIKEPTEMKHVIKNFEEITSNCSRRALSLPPLLSPYNIENILEFLIKLKHFHPKQVQKHNVSTNHGSSTLAASSANEFSIPLSSRILGTETTRYNGKDFLSPQVYTWVSEQLGVGDVRDEFTKIATAVVKVDVCRETTLKIKENNIKKILDYLKRIGFIKYLQVTYKDILDSQKNVVYSIVQDLYALRSAL